MSGIQITAEPIDNSRCKFVVSEPLYEAGLRRFASPEDAQGSPLAEAILAIEGVTEVIVSGHTVTAVKDTPGQWQMTARAVGTAIRSALLQGGPVIVPKAAAADGDDALYEQVADVFETRINPMVASHGGRVDLIDVQDGVVLLRLGGGCQGCGMANVTLRQGIETTLRQMVPAVQGIMDVTDHAAGADPYFAQSKK
jgi:Fe-S cluster biogenesis protein NfuA